MSYTLIPGQLTLSDIRHLLNNNESITLPPESKNCINASREVVERAANGDKAVYGINTGFGLLAQTRIDKSELETLQYSIVVSHAAGTGNLLNDEIVKLILLLKINSLARGFSGIRLAVIEALIALYNHQVYPCIPAKGSVGASGDLAPLAHLSIILLGEGQARSNDEIISAQAALEKAGLNKLSLGAKEGLALLNGTQVSTAISLYHLLQAEKLFSAALISGAMSVDAALGSSNPFDERIHTVRGHAAQTTVAKNLRELLAESQIGQSHKNCERVQDPYSLRCQPQVMGACLMHLKHSASVLVTEANGVTDNPLIFENDILSGGNFHAEPVAIAADLMAICISEIGAISERRIALLTDPNHNAGLPAFLVENPGVNSGFMLAHVTATACASENKTLAHPASIDSLPTSANQEDHVSMATFAANRLGDIIDNTRTIIAIELLAAVQGVDLRKPLKTSSRLQKYHRVVRQTVPFYAKDRYFSPDINKAKETITNNADLDRLIEF